MAKTTISVIIPTLNEATTVSKLLDDLALQSHKPDEIIVVDGNSTDGTVTLVRSCSGVRVVTSKRGVGVQRNVGGFHAHGDLLYFLDADIRINSNFIAESTTQITKQNLDCACPKYTPVTQLLSVKLVFSLLNWLFFVGQKHFPAGAGPCIIVKRSVFRKTQGFTAKLLVDDLDFVHRVGKKFKFGILTEPVFVSDRRFQKFGVITTTLQYLKISWLFIRGELQKTNSIHYIFGKFT